MTKFASFLRDESGASAAEYVLILTIIGTTLAAAVLTFGSAMAGALGKATATINGYTF
jgi:pilus assembly protein Flp/PilA